MKNFYFTAIALFSLIFAQAQIVNIPDANFKAKLISLGVDSNGDSNIQYSEALATTQLNLRDSSISSLDGIESFTNLVYLYCRNNLLTNLNITGLNNLQSLGFDENFITSINLNGLINLKNLFCDNNQLQNIDVSGLINLEIFYCGGNQLNNLNVSGLINCKTLECTDNNLTSLDLTGLNNLEFAYCTFNQITNLNVTGLTNLKTLNYSSNQMPNINLNGLTNLTSLDCSNNGVQSLNLAGLVNLETLTCSNNQLSTLNFNGLVNLKYLTCAFNQIATLDFSELLNLEYLQFNNNIFQNVNFLVLNNLVSLYCMNNQLSTLNVIGLNKLSSINCENNLLSNLDISSTQKVINLICSSNPLTNLNIKNNNLSWNVLDFSSNPNLTYICADDNDLALVQSKINNYGYTNCNVNSYCSFNPGGTFYTIQGNSPIDFSNDGCDATDPKYQNLKYTISNGTNLGSLIANNLGNYNILVEAGIHLISPQIENPSYFNVSPANISVNFPATASPFIQDFCITPNGIHHDLEVVIIPVDIARPGFDATYKIKYKNKGNQPENTTLNFNYDDAILDFVSTSTVPTSQITGNISWATGTLFPFANGEITVKFNLNSPMETPPLNSGDILSYTATCNGLNIDDTIADNTFNLSQNVVNSYDPNDKNCLEGNTINPAMIGEYIHYMIRFENTGTFAAQNVVVKDMIDTTKFEISTLQMTEASHSCVTKISDVNKVEFIFENINLPFDNATNDGYVVFKIKTKSNLIVGNTISNSANIYFDYNFPIVTNTATSTFQTPLQNDTFVFANYFSVYPNPANDVLNINSKQNIEINSLSIYNVLGQLLQTLANPTKIIDVSGLKTGNYILKVVTENGVSSSKFSKL